MSAVRRLAGCIGRELLTALLVFRRWYFMLFRRSYVRRMVARRKGVCGAHGCCFNHPHHRLLHRHCTDPADRRRCRSSR